MRQPTGAGWCTFDSNGGGHVAHSTVQPQMLELHIVTGND